MNFFRGGRTLLSLRRFPVIVLFTRSSFCLSLVRLFDLSSLQPTLIEWYLPVFLIQSGFNDGPTGFDLFSLGCGLPFGFTNLLYLVKDGVCQHPDTSISHSLLQAFCVHATMFGRH